MLAEGLAEMLPPRRICGDVARDEHGHVSLGKLDIGKLVAQLATERYEQRTGSARRR